MNSLKIILMCLFCSILHSCIPLKKQENQIKFRADIEILLDSIIKSSPSNKIYELYIDKIDPYNSNLLFHIGPTPLIEKEHVSQVEMFQIELNHKIVNIYSGLEKYISLNNHNIKKENEVSSNGNEVYWAIEDKKGMIKYYQIDFAYPFMPFPLKNEKSTFSKPIILNSR